MIQTGIKKSFRVHFNHLIRSEKKLMNFFNEIFIIGSAYVVGGYFRDFLINKESRDIDVIADIPNKKLLEILGEDDYDFTLNRHGGIKINFELIDLDIWSIQDNWAFKKGLVKLNEEDKLSSIARGCFYNYDSLVINLHNFSYNLKFYKEFISNNTLDILQSRPIYKNQNPTTEANILRAFYIKKEFGTTFTENTYNYLVKKIGYLNDKYDSDAFNKLIEIKLKYPKYDNLDEETISLYLNDLKLKDHPSKQILIDI